MITNFKLLQNIGKFNSNAATPPCEFGKLTLIYADNAQGKTTLTNILRSLASDNPVMITERHRLGSQHPPKVVLTWQGEPADVIFQDRKWNVTFPNLKVFNDNFVDENVYSGLDVGAHHRQNLHELILGDQGVALHRRRGVLVTRVVEHNTAIAEKGKAIPVKELFGLQIDEYCTLTELPDLDENIAATERSLKAANDQESIKDKPFFASVELPSFDTEAIRDILSKDLPDLDKLAEAQVQAHIQTLGDGGESWIADGMERLTQHDDSMCPFCGQDVEAIDLITHYQAYFGKEYARLKHTISELINEISRNHTDGKQAEFERSISALTQSQQFWSNYCEVPAIEVDTGAIMDDWNAVRKALIQQLKAKQSAPLEPQNLTQPTLDALNVYDVRRQDIAAMNETMLKINETIHRVKQQAEVADIGQIEDSLNWLKATKSRFREDIAPLCNAYLTEQEAKILTENARDETTAELEAYRNNIFPQLQNGVNTYLERFNADFRVENLTPSNIGGGSGSTCTFNVMINDKPIVVKNSKVRPGNPSFRNSLSAGDRNTLALALFFSSLDSNPNLAETVVVMDDAMSSLDNYRTLATVQTVREIARRAKQTIVLSHSKGFLCEILSEVDRHCEYTTLEIAPNGNESTIRHWNPSEDSLTNHDRRYLILRGYADNQIGEMNEVAPAIRLYLERYFRATCPGQFPPGKLLGQFVEECRRRIGCSDEVIDQQTISELKNILEYANRFHHDTNPDWRSVTTTPIELSGFIKRTLSLAGPPTVLKVKPHQ